MKTRQKPKTRPIVDHETLPHITLGARPDGIAVLTFDHPDTSANIFDATTMGELSDLLDALRLDPLLRGVVITSAKPSIFVAGADLDELEGARGGEVAKLVERGQRTFDKLAGLPVPTAAAIHGACLGGGLEMALACDWRIASPDKVTKIGLPETALGILPAWGGSTRLPRLIGLPKALGVILGARPMPPRRALGLGVVDELVPRERLLERALQLVRGDAPKRRRHLLANNPISAAATRWLASRRSRRRTRGHYPAHAAAIGVACRGAGGSVSASLRRERDAAVRLAGTGAAENLMRLFRLGEGARKSRGATGADPAERLEVGRTAVIGAGVMGAGIAQWFSSRGLPAILQDIDTTRVASGMLAVDRLYRDGVRRRLFSEREARLLADLVSPAATPVPLDRVDLVVEAAVEDLEVKKGIFRDLSARARPDAILATNTSALPVAELARAPGVDHPGRVLGLHFFNPVHRMKLVEVIATDLTDAAAVESALRFVRRAGKLPVLVKDRPGFLVNRVLMPYLVEAGRLFERGADPLAVDRAMLDFGMPVGPLRLLDEVGLDVAAQVAGTMSALGRRFEAPIVLAALVDAGHLGRKSGAGFFLYGGRGGSGVRPNPSALDLRGGGGEGAGGDRTATHLSLLMVDEGRRALDEGVARSADDIDLAMVLGAGFAPFRGGPMRYGSRLLEEGVRHQLGELGAGP